MAGSIKWILYQTDDGLQWAIRRDESNVEGCVIADNLIDIGTGSAIKYAPPRNVEPRYATFKSPTTGKTRRVTLPTREIYDDLVGKIGALAVDNFGEGDDGFWLQSLTPEKIRPVVNPADTGLNDGDAT